MYSLRQLALIIIALFPATSLASEAELTLEARQQIDSDLVAEYRLRAEQPQIIESIEFLSRGSSIQPITVVHKKNIVRSNRVLVIALDDNARALVTDVEDTVIIGVPLADRIRDLTPPTPENIQEGTPEWQNAQITNPDSDEMIRFLAEELIPYAEENYGPFFHKVLFGYSLGGLFTLQSLMSEPDLFDSYIAGSPSLWYRYSYYEALAIEAAKDRERFRGKCLILAAGEDEPSIASGTRRYERLLTGLRFPLMIHHQRNLETDHSHNRTLSFLYGWDRIFNMDDIFVPSSEIQANTLSELNTFLDEWLEETSCVGNSPMRSGFAYAMFATKLAADGNYDEMRVLLDYAKNYMPIQSQTYESIVLSLVRDFDSMPEEEKIYWAEVYRDLMSSKPTPYLAIHYINTDILEYLNDKRRGH